MTRIIACKWHVGMVPPVGASEHEGRPRTRPAPIVRIGLLAYVPIEPYVQPTPSPRSKEIVRRVRAGETMQAVADDYGISKQRVHQIVSRAKEEE